MKRALLLVIFLTVFTSIFAQDSVDSVLRLIEENNPQLKAAMAGAESEKLDNRSGALLDNPEIEFNYLFGSEGIGNRRDLRVTQAFDIATVAGMKKSLSDGRDELTSLKYRAARLEVLLQAKMDCIDLVYYNALIEELKTHLSQAQALADSYQKKIKAGGASVLDLNKAKVHLTSVQGRISKAEVERQRLLGDLRMLNGGEAVDFNLSNYGTSGTSGASGTSRFSGSSGASGASGTSGFSGSSGTSGTSGTSGASGTSGFSGSSGTSGTSGFSGTSDELPADFESWYEETAQRNPALKYLKQDVSVSEKQLSIDQTSWVPKLTVGYMGEIRTAEKFRGVTVGLDIPLWSNSNKVKRSRSQVAAALARQAAAEGQLYQQFMNQYNEALTLQRSSELMRSSLKETDSRGYLLAAQSKGEISMIDYLVEVDMYYETLEQTLACERDCSKALANLNAVNL